MLTGATDAWTQSLQRLLGDGAGLGFPSIEPMDAVDQFFGLAGRLMEVNHAYVKNLVGASMSFTTAVREHLKGLTEVTRDQAVIGVETVREQADRVEEAAREEVRQEQRALRAEARQVEKAQQQEVAAKYAHMTKVELSDLLAERDLPKTGNVEELRERLIEDELHRSA
jgi:hypothetical protein